VLNQQVASGSDGQSGMEQEPGPRGSPQLPHGPDGMGVVEGPLVWTAKTDSCEVRF
jgi:hypothetical protein